MKINTSESTNIGGSNTESESSGTCTVNSTQKKNEQREDVDGQTQINKATISSDNTAATAAAADNGKNTHDDDDDDAVVALKINNNDTAADAVIGNVIVNEGKLAPATMTPLVRHSPTVLPTENCHNVVYYFGQHQQQQQEVKQHIGYTNDGYEIEDASRTIAIAKEIVDLLIGRLKKRSRRDNDDESTRTTDWMRNSPYPMKR